MLNGFIKRICAILLVLCMLITIFPLNVFAENDVITNEDLELLESLNDTTDSADVSDLLSEEETTVEPTTVASAQQLEDAITSGAEYICIIADFEIDRTFFITKNVTIFADELHTLTRKADFAGDIFVIGESAEGVSCKEKVTLVVGDENMQESAKLIINGNADNMTVAVVGTVFFVCKNGQADLLPDLSVTNCKKVGNLRSLEDKHTLSNSPSNVGGAVGVIADGGTMDIYGGTYSYNGVETSGLYGGAFFNHGTMNVYDGIFEYNYALRAGVFYNYRRLNIHKATIANNEARATASTSGVGGAIYLPSSTGAILNIGEDTPAETKQVIFRNNSADFGGAISSSGTLVVRNASFEENTANKTAGAVYGNGKYNNISIYDSEFKSNKAAENAGAVFVMNQRSGSEVDLYINNCILECNEAGAGGGAVYVTDTARAYIKDSAFIKNTSVSNAGAAYISDASAEFNNVEFTENSATASGGAMYISENATLVMNKITAQKNKSTHNGGFLYTSECQITIYNSSFDSNTAESGGAFSLSTRAKTTIYNATFKNNIASAGNGGAMDIYTTKTDVFLQRCVFISNTASNFGGAMRVTSETPLTMYDIVATDNTAATGGFMYETKAGSVVTINGLTVSGNTASGGPIIWGNTYNATLNINKTNYVDEDNKADLDDAYWTAAIANKLTVNFIDGDIPPYIDYNNVEPNYMWDATDVSNADELQAAVERGDKQIRVTESFEIDRTFRISVDTVIFSTAYITLKRASGFDGIMFDVGGTEEDTNAELTLGISTSKTENLFVLDGNKDYMNVPVNGAIINVNKNSKLVVYKNATITSANYTPLVIDGELVINDGMFTNNSCETDAAVIYCNGTAQINGGIFAENTTTANGGVIVNKGTVTVYGATFSDNKALNGGVIYNENALITEGGIFEKNTAENGAVIYNKATLNMLNAEFRNNSASKNGGVVASEANISIDGALFESNKAANGGAIYIKAAENCEFAVISNSATFRSNTADNGGAIYAENVKLTITADFEGNSASYGGAVYMTSACNGDFVNVTASADSAKQFGGFLYAKASDVSLSDSGISSEKATKNGGAIYADASSTVNITSSAFENNTAKQNGGAICILSGSAGSRIEKTVFTGNSATDNGGAIYKEAAAQIELISCEFKDCAAKNGGAVYAAGGEVIINNTSLNANNASNYGGALTFVKNTTANLYGINAQNNTSANAGGFLYSEEAVLNITNCKIDKNSAEKSGGAMMFTGDTVAECIDCEFSNNTSTSNGGAVYIETDKTKVMFGRCNITSNTAKAYGGAFYIAGDSIVELYDNTVTKNTANYGAVIYETSNFANVTVNGMTVSGNTAKKSGYIIYGNSAKAVLRINKNNFTDKDKSGTLNDSYWAKAIVGSLDVKDLRDPVPAYGDTAVNVSTAAQLEKEINKKTKQIRIVADFEIDRTFFITSDITIFSDAPHTLKRAKNFGGDMFVVGETKSGEKAFFNSRVVKLTVGNPLSEKENLLTIDGNKNNMKAEVYGSVFFVVYGAKVELNDNLTVINCFKQNNERTYKSGYRLSRPNRIGGSVAVIANGMLTVNGGNYKYNQVNKENASSEEGRNSSIGGVFYNKGNLLIHGGNFEYNEGARGGIVYNYCIVKITAGTFKNNVGTKYSAIYYAPSSASIHLLIGNTIKGGEKVLIKNNTSANGPSAIYCTHFSAVVIYGNTVFKNNTVKKGSGGVIYVTGALTVKNTEFIGNSAPTYGGVAYLHRGDNDEITRLMNFEGCLFKDNQSGYGGAIFINSGAAKEYSKGANVTIKDCTFESNVAKSGAGAIYATDLTKLTLKNNTFVKNTSGGEAGALYFIGKANVTMTDNVFEANSATSHGGAMTVRSCNVTVNGGKFTDNKATKNGGAIYVAYSSSIDINGHLTVDGTTFKGNSADNGGAYYVTRRSIEENATLVNVKNSTFEGNTAKDLGGAILLTAGVKTYFKNIVFKNNNAVTSGGALQIGGKSNFELDGGSFTGNTSKQGGAITLGSSGVALINNVTATANASTSNGGVVYSEGGILTVYNSTINNNSGLSGGAMYLYTDAQTNIYNTKFSGNKSLTTSGGSVGNGGALFVYTGEKETLIHSCSFDANETAGAGGAVYVSGESKVKFYNNTASNNKANKGGFMYETKAGTVVDVVGLKVTGNTATSGGSVIWGNTNNAVLNIDKSKYTDTKVSSLNDDYWSTAIEGQLTVNNISEKIVVYTDYAGKTETKNTTTTKKPVSVEDVFTLAKSSSDADINENYNKLKKLNNSSNLMSRATADYPNINGQTVTVDTFVYQTNQKADNGIVGLGLLLYQALSYKKMYPKEEVHISVSSYRFSVQSAVNINRNSRYFGYMRNLVGKNYDEYGFVRLSYLLITAAKMGIHVTVIGQLDAYPISSSNPNFYKYFTQQLSDPCDPKYVKNGVIGDYLDFNFCYWTLDAKGGTDMMHTKMATVSHYLDKDGKVHKNAVWSSSSNLDGVKSDGQNANWKLQTATVVTNHKELYRVAYNYLQLITTLCGQEQVIEFQDIVNTRSTEQIALINQGRGNEIPADEQLVYLGTKNDDVFELYFTPFGGSTVAWDEVNNPYCKYLREMYESEDYILFTWNAAVYSNKFTLAQQMEDIIKKSFHENKNVKNKIYGYMSAFDATSFDDLEVGKDIGYKSFNEKPFGKVHNKDVQLSYVKNGQRYFVTLLNSLNMHSGSMCYQSNFMLVVKEKTCAENGVFSTIAKYSTTGDIAAHNYGKTKSVAATKTKDGYNYHECIYCGKKEIISTNHYSKTWITEKTATATEDGVRYKKCVNCNDIFETEITRRTALEINVPPITGKTFSASTPVLVGNTAAPLTLEARIQIPKSYSGRSGVIVGNYSDSGTDVVNLEGESNGKIKLYIKNDGKTFKHTFAKDIRSANPVDIAVVLNSSKATLYVNGKATESVTLTVSAPASVSKLKIGGDNRGGNTQYFKGTIYSVNLFNTQRTATQIAKDRLLVSPHATGLIYSGYFKNDKSVITTLSSTSFTAKTLNKLDNNLSAAPKTVEAVISLPKSFTGRGGVIFGNYNEKANAPFNLEIYTEGRVRIFFKNGSKTVTHTFNTDVRTKSGSSHIAVTLSGKTATLYLNGVKKESATLATSAPSATKNFCIGGDNRSGNSQYFKGKILGVYVFSDVRTATEIKSDVKKIPTNDSKLILSTGAIHTESGWKTDYKISGKECGIKHTECTTCGETLRVKTQEPGKHTHVYSTKTTKAATCTKSGTTLYSCNYCDYSYTKSISKLGHSYKTVTTKATLTKNGNVTTACSRCDAVKSKTTIYYPKTIKLSKSSYIYDGKQKQPSVTVKDTKGNTLKKDTDYTVTYSGGRINPGKYTVTIKFIGKYTGSKTLTFSITPATPTISKITSSEKGKVNLSWKSVAAISGYEVYYSTKKDSDFKSLSSYKSGTTSGTGSKLTSGKTYYLKVRAYKTASNGSKIYSSWSSVKSIKIK